MAKPVNSTPQLAQPTGFTLVGNTLMQFLMSLVQSVSQELVYHAFRLNQALMKDGSEAMDGPVVLKSYTVLTLPSAVTYANGFVHVSNEAGGAVPAFSDGTNWRRVTDRAIVS